MTARRRRPGVATTLPDQPARGSGPGVSAGSERYVRRPGSTERQAGALCLLSIAFLAWLIYMLWVDSIDRPWAGLLFFAVLLVVVVLGALRGLRPRLIADAEGLHVRNTLRSHHLPWPAYRSELVVVPFPGLQLGPIQVYRAVQYRPAGGGRSITIHALARSGGAVPETALKELWDWGRLRGYTGRRKGSGAIAPRVATAPADALALPIDLRADRLELRDSDISWRLSLADLNLWGRTTIDDQGFHVDGLLSREMAWPSSRSSLHIVVHHWGHSGVTALAYLVTSAGSRERLPGIGAVGTDPAQVLVAERQLDLIWTWGQRRGLTHGKDRYRMLTDLDQEQERASSRAYLRSLRRGLGRQATQDQ